MRDVVRFRLDWVKYRRVLAAKVAVDVCAHYGTRTVTQRLRSCFLQPFKMSFLILFKI